MLTWLYFMIGAKCLITAVPLDEVQSMMSMGVALQSSNLGLSLIMAMLTKVFLRSEVYIRGFHLFPFNSHNRALSPDFESSLS